MHSLLLIIHSGNPESRQSIRTLRSAPPTACTFSSLGIIVYHLFNVTYKESWINTVLMFVQVSLHNDMKNVWDILDRPIYCLFLLASSFLNVCLFLFDIWYLFLWDVRWSWFIVRMNTVLNKAVLCKRRTTRKIFIWLRFFSQLIQNDS